MSVLSTALTAVFMVAVDLVIAGGTGLLGAHAWAVDTGTAIGESLGIPHPDWGGISEGLGLHLEPSYAH